MLSLPNVSNAQSVTFAQDSRVNTLVSRSIEFNKIASVEGFRINIFFQSGNHSRNSAVSAQNNFSLRFPNMKSYVSFEEPYFRVNVGNFRTRLEAAAVLENLKAAYPQAHVVRDVLNIRDLLNVTSIEEEEEEGE
jgi:hypothetical protein